MPISELVNAIESKKTKYFSTIYDVLDYYAEEQPHATAVTQGESRYSYADLAKQVNSHARAMLAAGVRRGDRVATLAPPSIDFWLDYLAATSIGAIWQGLNPRYQIPEYQYLLEDATPSLVLITSPYEDRDYALDIAGVAGEQCQLVVRGATQADVLGHAAFIEAGEGVREKHLDDMRAAVEPEDIAVIVYTSGTTGKPKGAMLSHRAIVASAVINAEYFGSGLDSTICAAPINHVGALNNVCMSTFAYGGRIIFYHRVDLVALAEITRRELPTYLVASPTSFVMLQTGDPSQDLSRLGHIKLLVFGGGKTAAHLIEPIRPHVPKMYNVFGQTECCGIGTVTAHDASIELMANTIGHALPGHELRLANESKVCAIGEVGEIQLKGPVCCSGYWNQPQATAELFTEDGFLRTGDTGVYREDGEISYVGRIKEMYKSGGYNIYPVELEQLLAQHPDVSEAAVFPVPHDVYQEVGFAFVAVNPGSKVTGDDLDKWLRPQLANYKIPKHWSIETALPHLPNSKLDKQALKSRLEGFHA